MHLRGPRLRATFKQLGRLDEAVAAFQRLLALRPSDASGWNDLGSLYQQQATAIFGTHADGRDIPAVATLAIDAYRKAADASPASPEPWCNEGCVRVQFGRFDEGRTALHRALERDPAHWLTRMHLAQLELLSGNFDEGWRHFAARHHKPGPKPVPVPNLPPWRGEPLAGRSIALWYEEGFGDCIQFARYVPLLKAQGAARVAIVAPRLLARLLATVPGIDEVITDLAKPPAYDCWCYYLDVPMFLGTRLDTIPAALPYLHADPKAVREWSDRLPADGLRVGINWRGSPRHPNDRRRSLASVELLAPLWQVDGVRFVSLHKGPDKDPPPEFPPGQPAIDAGSVARDFADMAALIASLDLVITVDTAVAHLAGALGKPTWVMLPAPLPDWRWLLGREDSPWYPGVMRLFRQERDGDWEPVIARLTDELESLAAHRAPRRKPRLASAGAHLEILQRAVAAHAAGDALQAQQVCRSVLASQPDHAEALQLLGAIRAQDGAWDEAEVLLRRALAAQETPIALRNLGQLLRRTGRDADAVPTLQRWTQLAPGDANAWTGLAHALDKLDRFEEAQAAYVRAIELDQQAVQLKADFALLLRRRRKIAQVPVLLEQPVAALPGRMASTGTSTSSSTAPASESSLQAAFDAHAKGLLDEAESAYRAALEADERNPTHGTSWALCSPSASSTWRPSA